ncbi:hypothetical protein V1264_008097 [Littorina saxatilis]|uniref:BRCT domain-containing protein n=1 Tax=Littorina saxatilis TaxID=31220 RepID=A0AAN9G2I4_9CAEN
MNKLVCVFRWLLACARSGKREKEEKFDVDNINDTNTSQIYQQEPPAAKPATSNAGKGGSEAVTKNATKPEIAQPSPHSKPQNVSPEESSFQSKQPSRRSTISKHQETNSADAKTHKQTELAPPSSSADSVKSIPASSTEKVPSSLASDHERNDLAAMSSDDVNNPMGSVKSMVQQQGKCPLSQKENLTATVRMKGGLATTPVRGRKGCHGRVEELQQQSRKPILSPGLESPSVFLAPGYRPNFNLKAVFEYLKTPEGPQKGHESPTLEEVFRHHLAEGVKNSSMARTADNLPPSSQNSQAEERGALEGVVISVSKKLGVNQTEYNRIVVELGGDYTWQYTDSCTHFIFQGRVNDLNKEYRLAKSQGKIIVSPHWLYACVEQRLRVDESMYPHSYNPNLNLGGVVKTETPSRSVRRSARKTPKHDDDNTQAQTTTTKTPARLRSEPKTPAKAAAESWEESMNEMKKWQQSGASNTKTPKDSGKKRLGAVVEVSTLQTSPSKREEKGGGREKVRTSSAESLSSNDERNGDSKAGGDVEISTEIQESECRVQEEVKVTEVTAAESGGSLEIREALTKTLESMKASSSRSKKSSKRRNRRTDPNSSGDQTNLSGNLPDASRHASPWETNHAAQGAAHTAESFGGEASQSVQITWDDPTGRREQERLAHKLDMVCGPSQNTQNTEDFMANMDMPDLNHTADGSKVDCVPARQHPVRSPTPEPPPLAFPTAKNVCKVLSPQPVELLSEESSESHSDRDVKPIILTSGMGPQERIEYAEVVERLGGTVLEKQQFDPACTHVVVIKPSRNEKFLAAVATGRWVLHKSYLIACRQEGKFVREESHEWGNPAMSHLMQSLDGQTYNLVQAAFKWRQKVHSMRKSDPSCKGAFQGWRVILLTELKREENFKRLLSAGGATIVSVKPPFTEVSATHAFVELHKVKLLESDLQALVCGVDHILKPEFIAAHLTEQAPAPENHTPAEIVNLRASLQQDQSRKRKAAQTDGNNINISSSNKRLRR